MRVVFFGTPEFAVPAFEALLGEGFDVAAVVTRPDRPRGRSRSQLLPAPVKVAAQAEDVPVLEPERPTSPEFYRQVRALHPDVGVVVAYGHILSPELRGAAPIEWAILNGLDRTGVTIMQMHAGLDSGPILHQIPDAIPPEITGGELSEHLAELGAQALIEALGLMEQGRAQPVPQDESRATHAPKLTREMARIRWDRGANEIARAILALDPKPGAWTELDGREVKLFGARATDGRGAPGEVLTVDGRLLAAAGTGAVEVEEVQPAGKPRMPVADWIHGRGVRVGERFT